MTKKVINTIILCLCLPFILYDKPVSVDEIFTPKRQFKLIGSFSYINLLRKDTSMQSVPVQMSDSTFINIPFVGYQHTKSRLPYPFIQCPLWNP
ncbi:hypothetical protein V3I05_09915 [Helicobacter mastomyrinus]|uniref:Uncharacterized protein n=1 Tax=Helicobacter mastomyrinus TaxID=287948 RepID=A0ABZ3F4D5_9HELI